MALVMHYEDESLIELAKLSDALYICPKADSRRTGPLVAYAGKDAEGRNLVGDVYFNFRKIERNPIALDAFADEAHLKLSQSGLIDSFDTICGIPNGGRSFGQMLALVSLKGFTYPEKKPIETEPGKKQEYAWDLSQFEFEPGERIAIAEDVFNNFQNTDQTLEQIAATGAEVTLLIGALNRSPVYGDAYVPKSGRFAGKAIPIVACIREAYPEYRQDDPEVAADIAAGNVEFEVKKHWAHLRAAMQKGA